MKVNTNIQSKLMLIERVTIKRSPQQRNGLMRLVKSFLVNQAYAVRPIVYVAIIKEAQITTEAS